MSEVQMTSHRSHPSGLAVLTATELAERFSYYGMTAILVLYMVKELLLPGQAQQVWGLAQLRGIFEVRGPISDQAFASLMYGWYSGLVYLTPIAGGWLADRWLGARRTVIMGAVLMAGGHLAMSFYHTFLLALTLLILGSGCLKGNISAQVGALYPLDAEGARARGFTIFSTGINIGSIAGPLATGAVAAVWGWHAGFAVAAGLMMVALAIYLFGQRYLPAEDAAASTARANLPPLTMAERRKIAGLAAIVLLTVPISISYSMLWNVGVLWVDQRVDLNSPFGTVPASWFTAIDSSAGIIIAAPLLALWAWQSRRGTEPASVTKIAIGALVAATSGSLLAVGAWLAGPNAPVSVLWAIAGFFGYGVAFMWFWPVVLALVSQHAPRKYNAMLVSSTFISLFLANTIMGWLGSFYDQATDAAFWWINAGIALFSFVAILAVRKQLAKALA